MVKENLIPIVNQQKLVEEIRELEESSWWQEYKNQTNKSKLSPAARNKVISKSGSDFVSERGKEGYGPMPFGDEALTIAHSDAIMRKIRNEFPNVARLIGDMPAATLGFLKANGALSGYRVITHDFGFPFTDTTSKSGPGAWQRYKEEAGKDVERICRENLGNKMFEELWGARRTLTDYIVGKYYDLLPYWPSVGETNIRSFEANIGSSYDYGSNSKVVWNCLGWITVKDERPKEYTYKAQFSGSPEIKVLVLNGYAMREIENDASYNYERARQKISGGESRYRQIDWDTKYI